MLKYCQALLLLFIIAWTNVCIQGYPRLESELKNVSRLCDEKLKCESGECILIANIKNTRENYRHLKACNGVPECDLSDRCEKHGLSRTGVYYYWCIKEYSIDKCAGNVKPVSLPNQKRHLQSTNFPYKIEDLNGNRGCVWKVFIKQPKQYRITTYEFRIDASRYNTGSCSGSELLQLTVCNGTHFEEICNWNVFETITVQGNLTITYRPSAKYEPALFWIYLEEVPLSTVINDTTNEMTEVETTSPSEPMDQGSMFIAVGTVVGIGGLLFVVGIVLLVIYRKKICKTKANTKQIRMSSVSEAELEDNPLYANSDEPVVSAIEASSGSKKYHPYEEIPCHSPEHNSAAQFDRTYAEIPENGLHGKNNSQLHASHSKDGLAGHFYAEIAADKNKAKNGVNTPLKASMEDFYAEIPGENVQDKKHDNLPMSDKVKNEMPVTIPCNDDDEEQFLAEYAVVDKTKKQRDREQKAREMAKNENKSKDNMDYELVDQKAKKMFNVSQENNSDLNKTVYETVDCSNNDSSKDMNNGSYDNVSDNPANQKRGSTIQTDI